MTTAPRHRARPQTVPAPAPRPRERTRTAATAEATVLVQRDRPDASGIGRATDVVKNASVKKPVDLGSLGPTEAIAHMRIGGGTTIPTKPFAGIRVDVAIDWPFAVDTAGTRASHDAAIEATYQYVSGKLESLIQREIDLALDGVDPAVAHEDDRPV